MLKNFRNIQTRALKIITKTFKTTTKLALNIKVYVLSIKQRLKKLINDIMLRIIITSSYKNIINKQFKKQKRKRTSLKKLIFKFKKRIEIKSKSIKKIKSFIILSWWKLSKTMIFKNKKTKKKLHETLHDNKKKITCFYTRIKTALIKKLKSQQ